MGGNGPVPGAAWPSRASKAASVRVLRSSSRPAGLGPFASTPHCLRTLAAGISPLNRAHPGLNAPKNVRPPELLGLPEIRAREFLRAWSAVHVEADLSQPAHRRKAVRPGRTRLLTSSSSMVRGSLDSPEGSGPGHHHHVPSVQGGSEMAHNTLLIGTPWALARAPSSCPLPQPRNAPEDLELPGLHAFRSLSRRLAAFTDLRRRSLPTTKVAA